MQKTDERVAYGALLSEKVGSAQQGFSGGASGEEPACQCRRCKRLGFSPWVGKIPLEKEMATHSCVLAWRIPWTEEPGKLQSMGEKRVGHDSSDSACMHSMVVEAHKCLLNDCCAC